MKKIKLLIAMLTIVAIAKGGSITLNKDTIYTWQEFVSAVIMVESSGNDSAYNKSEDAVGCLQIRPIMVREVNRLLKIRGDSRRYTLLNRWNRQKSIEMFLVYNFRITNFEEQSRRWNGGNNGMNKTATIKYWNKVKKELINNK